MLRTLLDERRPAEAVNVLDADWRPAWRVAAYAGYKSDRRPDPPELEGQVDVLLELLEAAGVPVAQASGYEADDVIATLAEAAGVEAPAEIASGDRDLLQLVRDPAVRLLFIHRGVHGLEAWDEAAVAARFGVAPALYADLATLRGDQSDGLPGVPGIGEKTAAALLHEHGSLAAVRAATSLPPRLARAIDGAAGYLDAMAEVVPVVRNCPGLTVTQAHPPDDDRLTELAARHAVAGPVRRLLPALRALEGRRRAGSGRSLLPSAVPED